MNRRAPWILVVVLSVALLTEEWRLRRPGPRAVERGPELDARPPDASEDLRGPRSRERELESKLPARESVEPAASSERSAAPESSATLAQRWLARFQERPEDGQHAQKVAGELIEALAPDEAFGVMSAIWTELTDVHRIWVLGPFVRCGHARVLGVLDLAARDPNLKVQQQGLRQLRGFAFQAFEEDFEAYLGWAERMRALPPAQAIQASVPEFLARLGRLQGPELRAGLSPFTQLPFEAGEACGLDMRALFATHGALALVQAWILSGDEDLQRASFRWVSSLRPDEAWMRAQVLPIVESETTGGNARAEALGALGHPDHAWAKPYLLDRLRRTAELDEEAYQRGSGSSFEASALAGIGDPSVIPELIRILAAHGPRNPRLNYDVGYFGLHRLTGVGYDESHDAAWWLEWWEKNRARFEGSAGR